MNRVILGRWLIAAAMIAALHSWPALGQEEYSGAFYFGNSSPCGGIIGPTDVTNVKLQNASGTGNYFGCKPQNPLLQDVDGDGNVAPADVGKIKLWVAGNFGTGAEGKAYSIEALTPTFIVPAGATCADGPQVCVKVWDNPNLSNLLPDVRYGWGVNFKVDPASECPTAILCGRDPTPTLGLGKNQFIQDPMVFQYSGMDGPGEACITVADPGGCGGKTVSVNTYVPDDPEALYQTGTIGRFSGLAAVTGAPITGFVSCAGLDLTVAPDPGAVNDGNTIQMTAIAQCIGDVTSDPNTSWSVTSGPCTVGLHTGLVTADEGCSAASCTIEAVYDPGTPRQDSALINVTDNEAGTWTTLSPITCNPANDGGIINCGPTPHRLSADGCDRGPASCAWSCPSGCLSGLTTAELCMPALTGPYTGRCTDGPASVSDASTAINNETTPRRVEVIPPGPVTVWPGTTLDFTGRGSYADGCTAVMDSVCDVWLRSGNCTGAAVNGSGLYTATSTNMTCTDIVTCQSIMGGLSDSATVNTPAYSLTVTPNPGAVNDGNTIRFTATDNHDGDVTQDPHTSWYVSSGPCTVNTAAPDKGLVTGRTPCGQSSYSCTIRAVYNPKVSRENTAALNVTNPSPSPIATVTVTPDAPVTLRPNRPQDYYALGTCTDGNTMSLDTVAAWTRTGGCTGAGLTSSGLYTSRNNNADCTDTVTATYAGVSDSSTVATLGYHLTVTPNPAAVSDGATIRFTATENLDGDITQNSSTNWSVTSGACTVNNAAPKKGLVAAPEQCANYACTIQASYYLGSAAAALSVGDNEAGTFDQVVFTCQKVNDGSTINCPNPRRRSSADGCDRGASPCSPA